MRRIKEIEDDLAFDSDNGSEFLNWAVFWYFHERRNDRRLLERINALYAGPWRALQNFFLPSMQVV
jgi:hypothetical protein